LLFLNGWLQKLRAFHQEQDKNPEFANEVVKKQHRQDNHYILEELSE